MFCPNDRSLMRLQGGARTCPKCGHRESVARAEHVIVKGVVDRRIDKLDDLGIIDPEKFEQQIWPIDDNVYCGGCRNRGAYYYQLQTRRSDEPPTTFYMCTKCKRKWKQSK